MNTSGKRLMVRMWFDRGSRAWYCGDCQAERCDLPLEKD